MSTPAVVIFNGPSRLAFKDIKFPGLVFGCNLAYEDWPLTHCWAVDRMTVALIRKRQKDYEYNCEFWTKESTLELPPNWQHRVCPGIDSGSAALDHALSITQGQVILIGCDGIMGGAHDTAYTYPWRGGPPTEIVHSKHRKACLKLLEQHPGRIIWAWDQPNPPFETKTVNEIQRFF